MRQMGEHQEQAPVPVHMVGVHLRQTAWAYIAGMFALAVMFLLLSVVVVAGVQLVGQSMGFDKSDPALSHVGSLIVLAASILALKGLLLMQNRSLMSVVAPERHLDLGIMARSAGIYVLAFMPILIMVWMSGQVNLGNWQAALALLPIMLVLVALQATAEEMVCRGYLAQGFQILCGHAALAALPVAGIFLLLHDTGDWDMNWDRKVNILMISLGLSWLTVRTGRLEPAMGVHFAHNILIFTLMSRPEQGVPSVSGFEQDMSDQPFNWNDVMAQMLVYGAVCANYWFLGLRTGFVEAGWSAQGEGRA